MHIDKSTLPTLILHHPRICTMSAERPWVEAISVHEGRIVAIGTLQEARAALPGARVVDLPGAMVVPGLLDVHNHFVWAGRAELYEMFVPPFFSLDQVLAAVRDAAAGKAPGEWIVGGIWGSSLMDQLDQKARKRLDEAAGGRPVMLRDDSHHNRFVSSAALEAAGILDDTPDPTNGRIVRDPATGAATGLLLEAACSLVEIALAKAMDATPHLDVEAAAHAIKRLNACGVTGMQEALTTRAVLRAVKALEDQGRLSAWVVGSVPVTEAPLAPGEAGEELLALREQFRSRHFMPDAGKIFLDGVPTSRTAAMLEPYLPDAVHGCCFRGGTTLTVPQLAKVLADSERRGIRVKIHCTGDASTRAALDAIDVVRSFNGPGLRHQIAHASFVDPAEIPRFAELDVVADLSPPLWFPSVIIEAIRSAVPQPLVDRIAPIRSLIDAGALIAGGSDWPVVPDPSPWPSIQGMVTRRDPSGRLDGALCPEEAIGVEEALRAYTINAAQATGLAHLTGSIEVGKSADLAILDTLLFDVDPGQLGATQVLQTWFEGRCVHGATA
ncbi:MULTISPECIES: amidohydrolase [unclassified Acidovorax]|uniref:amidohydrolase n=1 Tax=unclassified Acidovorax TaxID=2684926 RepID=UPI001C47273D|nr:MULTISPECIES: amidohydrolase [unclassified Acidovorax]MBV7429362.1 amidohydrolase [Acidovorax sp. sif0732]MBV7451188.1 amidohydrolase [Acidovorax sp. sif0715]